MLRTPALDRGMAQAETRMKTDTDPDYIHLGDAFRFRSIQLDIHVAYHL